ncbi:MAG: acyloxyacyl hydrolase [Gracilimonas sp.]|nr:acyloxyacyl hydrolase [Gracilimonas sp.]
MRTVLTTLLLFIVCTSSFPPALCAQEKSTTYQFNFWGGYSFTSVKLLGKTKQAETQILAIGIQRKLKEYPNNRHLWYTADVIPYLEFYYPKRDESYRFVNRSGLGISPVGFLITQHLNIPLTPYLQSSGGIIYMENNFPTDKSRRLNFTFDITIGSIISLNSFSKIYLGYKFHHISNAETGDENPGLDSNFLFINLSFH